MKVRTSVREALHKPFNGGRGRSEHNLSRKVLSAAAHTHRLRAKELVARPGRFPASAAADERPATPARGAGSRSEPGASPREGVAPDGALGLGESSEPLGRPRAWRSVGAVRTAGRVPLPPGQELVALRLQQTPRCRAAAAGESTRCHAP